MHIISRKNIRIIALFMCILLLSNFGLSIAYATDNTVRGSAITLNSGQREGGSPEANVKGYTTTYTFDSLPLSSQSLEDPIIVFTPQETGVYTLSLTTKNGDNLRYGITSANTTPAEAVRLAGKYVNAKQYAIMTNSVPRSNTTVDVVLEAGKQYRIVLETDYNNSLMAAGDLEDAPLADNYLPIIFGVTKHNLNKNVYAALNISANNITSPNTAYSDSGLETYSDPTMKIFEFTQEEIEEYLALGINEEEKVEPGGALEGILADIILDIGTILTNLIEVIIGIHDGMAVSLTIDNIIFNKVDYTVIDFSPLGGIQINTEEIVEGKNILSGNVNSAIKVLFDALKNLAIVVYIVMLLYIGVTILLNIGGKNQRKYTKYLENWVVGLLILAFVPYFLPIIPAISNSIVALMGKQAHNIQGTITVQEALQRLGMDGALLAEDAEVVAIQDIINGKIEELNGQISNQNSEVNIEEAKQKLNDAIDNFTSTQNPVYNWNLNLKNEAEEVENYIDANYNNWTESNESEYKKMISSLAQKIINSSTTATKNFIQQSEDRTVRELFGFVMPIVDRNIDEAESFISQNIVDWDNSKHARLRELFTKIETQGNYDSRTMVNIRTVLTNVRTDLTTLMATPLRSSVKTLLDTYKDAVVRQEISELENLRDNVGSDIMSTLKTYAQEQNRVIYAIAWAILLYQAIALLFMYYKRVFAIIVLIILFPIVMAFYVFDKMDDGESQALRTWTKEMFANIFVQVLHAAIYITIINVGIDICNANPRTNWFVLLITVCFLFPGERILRGVLGLEASTLGSLKNNVLGSVLATAAAFSVARNGVRLAKGGINSLVNGDDPGIVKSAKEKITEPERKREKRIEEKKKRRNDLAESKKKVRQMRQDMARQKINDGTARLRDRAYNTYSNVRKGIANSGVGKVAIATGHGVKKAFNAVKNNKVIRGVAKTGRYAYRTGKFVMKGGQKFVGAAMGMAEGFESFGKDGPAGAITTAVGTARTIGGFKAQEKNRLDIPIINESRDELIHNRATAAKYNSVYSHGRKVGGTDTRRITPGNQTRTRANRINSSREAQLIRSKVTSSVSTKKVSVALGETGTVTGRADAISGSTETKPMPSRPGGDSGKSGTRT